MRNFYIFLTLLVSINSFANPNPMKTVQIDSHANQFDIILTANPTTGFQWTVGHYDHSFLLLKKSYFVPSTNGSMGAGGKMIFTFNKVGKQSFPDTTVIEFRYARSWESKGGQITKVLVRFEDQNMAGS